jgi:hypothetical protein
MQTILLLSLLSPLAEAFPNHYMSWWVPTNGNWRRYLETWPRRVVIVFAVWLPILITLAKISGSVAITLVIATFVFSAFGLRLYLFDRYLNQELEVATGSRAPGKLSKVPEFLYLVAFSNIGFVLLAAVPNMNWLVPVAISIICLGASIMATYRWGPQANRPLDILGRCMFVIGFLLNLYNLHRAASSVPIG